jgi:threonine/homoserine/homoserine lactone efflux protein
MIHYLSFGIILGLSAGFSPGPLLTLVISETLQHNIKAGIRVALAPVITDFPIVVLSLFILANLSNSETILGVISIFGGLFVMYLGWENIRINGFELNLRNIKPKSLSKGILTNFLSPHPYLFWLSVGAPVTTKAFNQNQLAPFAFIGSFYLFLVGAKVLIAIFVGKSKSFLQGKGYIYATRLLGLALCILALVLFYDGLKLLGFFTN